jgi:hypothetical protein
LPYSGVAFVENGYLESSFFSFSFFLAMNRAYTEADKMILIAKYYYVLNISQTLSMVGAFLFVIVVIIPTWTCQFEIKIIFFRVMLLQYIKTWMLQL